MLLSAPCGGGGRLPHPETLKRLNATGGSLGWTGRDGAVALELPLEGESPIGSQSFRPGEGRFCPEMGVSRGTPWRARHRKP